MYKISKIYFNFENNIKIDLKSNLGDGGQSFFVTLVTPIYGLKIKEELIFDTSSFKFYRNESSNNLNCLNCDQILYKLIDCLAKYKMNTNYFLSKGIELTDYSVFISKKEYQSSGYILNKTSAYYYYIDFDMEVLHLDILDTIEINPNTNFKKDNSFFEIHVFDNKQVTLVITSYNSLKSYRVNLNYLNDDYSEKTILVLKTMHHYLKAPYGNCSDYQDHLFNSTNQWQCYRQCIKTFAEKKFNCKPVFIENTLHELDSDYYLDCNSSVQKKFDEYFQTKNLSSKCIHFCPKNCLNIDYEMKVIRNPHDYGNVLHDYFEHTLYWDTTQPMFVYKEVPVLSFIEYMVYLGGLVGLWFGTSAKDIIIILFEKTFWLNLWNIFQIKFNSNTNSIIVRHYNDK